MVLRKDYIYKYLIVPIVWVVPDILHAGFLVPDIGNFWYLVLIRQYVW